MSNDLRDTDRNYPGSGSDSGPELSDDRLYRALASTQRRRLLYLLLDERECPVETLATLLTGWVARDAGETKTAGDRKRIRLTLEHVHLPLLAETGLVSYDRQNGSVAIGSVSPAVEDLISQSVESERPPPP